jgi:hypothetical protein
LNGSIIITLEDGTVFSGVVTLSPTSSQDPVQQHAPATAISTQASPAPVDALDFSLPLRPFMNDYADGLSGSKKLALLVAHFAGGQLDVAVDRAEVIEAWNKMTGLLGGKFNGAHESRAKDSGYVYVPETGKLALLRKWRQVLA